MWSFPVLAAISCVLILGQVRDVSSEKPTFRILAPKFICGAGRSAAATVDESDDSGSGVTSGSPQQITIGLQTKGGQRLEYRVKVMFTLLEGFVSQRHTLQLWRSVRTLEQRILKERDTISARNQIAIPNEELVAGVIYTFNIVGLDEAGRTSDGQNFTVTYRGRNAGGTSVDHAGSSASEDVSLLLLGSESCYADTPYVLTAKVVFCEPRNDYKIQWSAPGVEDIHKSFNTASNVLYLPAGTFKPGNAYELMATVLDSTNGNEIAKARMKINVLERALKGNIYPSSATAGFAQTTQIRVAFNKPAISDVSWKCEDSAGDHGCSEDLLPSENSASISFLKEANYSISVVSEPVTLTSSFQVNPKSTISVSLHKLPPLYLIPGERNEVLADVSGLVPKCTCNWTAVKEADFATLDSNELDKLGGIFINDVEENFLSELVDYGNDTLEREVRLSIPRTLRPNVSYKFRLVTSCPEPIDDSVESKPKQRGTVTSHWDMVLETNAPPSGLPLEVTPIENGTVLNTFYTFSTGVAGDVEMDFPLKYMFWYTAEGKSINIGEYYEIMSAETQLPYSREAISTFYLVCDSRQACSRIEGPSVNVQPNVALSLSEVQFRVDAISKNFDRDNYKEAMKIAFETLLTLKNQESTLFDDTFSRVMTLLSTQIPQLKRDYQEQTKLITAAGVLQFTQQAKVVIDFKHGSNDQLLVELLDLIDAVEQKHTRRKRSPEPKPILTNNAETQVSAANQKLEYYQHLIKQNFSSSIKQDLLNYIPKAAVAYCTAEPVSGYTSVDGWLMLAVELLSPKTKNLTATAIRIPDNEKLPQKALMGSANGGIVSPNPADIDNLCLAKVMYGSDLLTANQSVDANIAVYQVFVMAIDKAKKGNVVNWKDGRYSWNVTVVGGSASTSYQCELWDDKETSWDNKPCNTTFDTDHVVCDCSKMSYLRVITTNSSVETSTTPVPTRTVNSTEASTTTLAPATTPGTDLVTVQTSSTQATGTTTSTTQPSTTTQNASTQATGTTASTTQPSTTTQSASTPSTATPAGQQIPTTPSTVSNPTPTTVTSPNTTNITATSATLKSATPGTSSGSSLGYSLFGALLVGLVLAGVAVVLYRRRRNNSSLSEELQIIAARVRTQSPPVRYARFQDEHNMGGDNVSTISDTVTV